jgi:hypothetical protein
MLVAKKRTAEADTQLDDRGHKIDETAQEFGEHVLIVEQPEMTSPTTVVSEK